jgi:anti-anti-sigma factor
VAVEGGFDDALVVEVEAEPPGTCVLRLSGDIDMLSSQHLRSVLTDVLEAQAAAANELVFDVGAVGFVDSSGLSVLINVARGGRRVVLRNPTDVVRRVVETTGLTQLLPMEP